MTEAGSSNVRGLAVKVALRRHSDDRFLEEVLDATLESDEGRTLDGRDRALLTELVLGTCRRRVTLDHLLTNCATRPLARIEPGLLEILRQATYQVVFLTRIPVHAAVDEAVSLARGLGNPALVGFANAVLRSVARNVVEKHEGPDLPTTPDVLMVRDGWVRLAPGMLPDAEKDLPGFLSVKGSMPRVMVERWLDRWDLQQVEVILRASNEVPRVFIRVNQLRTDETILRGVLAKEGRSLNPGPVSGSWVIEPAEGLAHLEAFREGLFWVMDPAGVRAVEALGAKPGERVLDLCSAPGGKTALIASDMDDRGEIVAMDVSADRLVRLKENVKRLRFNSIRAVHGDGKRVTSRTEGLFDRVLVDAPCSNTGVLARRVEARHRFRPERLGELARLQGELLRAALRVARPEGIVIYSTCSLEPEENDGVVAGLEVETAQVLESGISLPKPGGADGGFVARIRKR